MAALLSIGAGAAVFALFRLLKDSALWASFAKLTARLSRWPMVAEEDVVGVFRFVAASMQVIGALIVVSGVVMLLVQAAS